MTKHHKHYIVHKPYGFLSQFVYNQRRRKNKGLLGQLHDFEDGTMAIGRLDANTEGLILLTTNGKMSALVRGRKVEKEYYAQVDGLVTKDAINKLKNGVEITVDGDKYLTLPCQAKKLVPQPNFPQRTKHIRSEAHGPTSWVSITLTEGKNRQVRKMTAGVGFPTLRLFRVRIGNIHLDELKTGEVIEVKQFDL